MVDMTDALDRPTMDGLNDLLLTWASSAGAASPGAIEPAIYLDQAALDAFYRVNTYAQRICDALPDEATRRGWEITYGEQDRDEAEADDPIGDDLWRIGLKQALNRAGKLARKDGLAAIYLGVWDGQDTREPIDESRIVKITHCTLVERDQIQPATWQSDFTKPGFGEPETYQLIPFSAVGASTPIVYVHRSRLLILEGKWIPPRLQAANAYSPDSVLQRCWRLVQDFRRTEGDLGVLLRTYSQGTLTIPTLSQLLAGGNTDAALSRLSLVATSRSVFGMALLGEGEALNYVTRSVAGLSDLYDRLAQGLSATAEMPLTLLFGHSPSGLSTDDSAGRTYWYARVASYQQNELQPHIERTGRLLALAKQGPMKGKEPERWEVGWLPLTEPTEAERTDQRSKQATTDKTYWEMGVLSEKEIRESRFGSGQYSVETTLSEEEEPEAPPEPAGTAPSAQGAE
uniref:Anti-CBASS protein Acb1-like N-terminal domain-containing protein n=1 Tax=viral metagenome TaxID=1070528 RepID=A0A6H1ZM00_9ZZZZ